MPIRPITPIADDDVIWERCHEESRQAFEAFCHFRDVAPADRSIRFAYRSSKADMDLPSAPASWYDWSQRFRWKERAAAYDAYKARRELDAEIRERVKAKQLRRGVLVSGLRKTGQDLPNIDLTKSSASDIAKLLEVLIRQLREEYDETPAQKIALGGLKSEDGADMPIVISYAQSKV